MRRRLLVILLVFAALAVYGFSIPLGAYSLTTRTQEFWFSRHVDAEWFAGLAEKAMETGRPETLVTEMRRYRDLYSDRVLVVDASGAVFANTGVDTRDSAVVALLTEVRSNRHAVHPPHRLRPWDPDVLRVAHPVGVGVQVEGAVLIEASTVHAKRDITDRIAILALAISSALLLFTLVALGLSRWLLRPLAKLSDSVVELTRSLPTAPGRPAAPVADRRYDGPPEVRELARSFDAMSQAVSDAVDAQRQLVADTAHAIRNPLAALAFRLESLSRVIPDPSQESFRRANRQVERLSQVLDGLLKLAVAETPNWHEPQADTEWPRRCDLTRLVEESVEEWHPAAAEAGVTLAASVPAESVEVEAPADAIVQILDVLLSNVCRYAGTGVTAAVRVTAADGDCVLSVADNGSGVAAAELAKLTSRFYRGSTVEAAGTGLGLAIAAALAPRHRGELTVAASHPTGLAITVRLTAARALNLPD
ncbi:MAG: HAMP domain-containing histidine kinase [Mycobacteriaceae bacterium]|nr:HAMP domain-containing histidine kinase [Mycobacteriaceae bacterium]